MSSNELNQQVKKILRNVQTQRTKRKNEAQNVHICENIINYFKEGGIPLLDRMPPKIPKPYTSYREIYNYMEQSKSTSGITITYKSLYQNQWSEEELRQYTNRTIRTIVQNKDIPIKILLIPDMDENGNFHYHGLIQLPIKYRHSFKRLMTMYHGYIKYDYLTNTEGWKKYVFKDIYNENEINALSIYLNI